MESADSVSRVTNSRHRRVHAALIGLAAVTYGCACGSAASTSRNAGSADLGSLFVSPPGFVQIDDRTAHCGPITQRDLSSDPILSTQRAVLLSDRFVDGYCRAWAPRSGGAVLSIVILRFADHGGAEAASVPLRQPEKLADGQVDQSPVPLPGVPDASGFSTMGGGLTSVFVKSRLEVTVASPDAPESELPTVQSITLQQWRLLP